MILNKIADVSRPCRHKLASLIVPKIYYNRHEERPMIDFIHSQNKPNLVGVLDGYSEDRVCRRQMWGLREDSS